MSKRPLPTPPMELPTNIQMLRGFRSRMRRLNEARAQHAALAADEAASHDSAAGTDEAAWHDSAAGADGAAWPEPEFPADWPEAEFPYVAEPAPPAEDDQAEGAHEPEFSAHPPVDPAVAEAIQAVLEAVDRLCTVLGV